MELGDPARDEVLADRAAVGLGEERLDLVVGRGAMRPRIASGSS